MTIDLTKRYAVRPGVVFFRQGDRYILTDLVAISNHLINATAYDVLQLLSGKFTLAEIVRKLQVKYADVDGERISTDVQAIMATLAGWNMVIDEDLKTLHDKYHASRRFQPGLMYWEVTNRCNYRCLMCYNESGRARQQELTREQGLEALQNMKKAGTTTVIFTGGEPTLRRDELLAWLRACTEMNISTEMFTNGSRLTADYARELKDAGLGYCRVSMQAARPETFDRIALVKGAHLKSRNGMRNMIEAGIPTCWSITTNQISFPEVRLCVEEAIALGCQGIRFGSLDVIGKGEDSGAQNVRLSASQELSLWKFIEEAIIYYGDRIKIGFGADLGKEDAWRYYVTNPIVPPLNAAADPLWYMRYCKNSLCGIGIRSAGINSRGDIVPCPALADLKMGHILHDDLATVWDEAPYLKVFRQKILEDFESCGSCGHRYLCVGGCRANAFHQEGSLLGRDPRRCCVHEDLDAAKDLEVTSFFAPEEIDCSKYPLSIDLDMYSKFYGPRTEGLGPWIPYNAVVFRKKQEAPEEFIALSRRVEELLAETRS